MGHFDESGLEAAAGRLTADGIDVIRLTYSDLIGSERGRDLLVQHFPRTVGDGVAFCRSVYGTTPMGDVVDMEGGLSEGLPDIVAFPDLETFRPVPWEPGVASVIADLFNPDGSRSEESPRAVLRRVVDKFAELGMRPFVGPELEFYLLDQDAAAPGGWRRYGDATGNVYVSGLRGDPENTLLDALRMLGKYGLDVVAANHEFSGGQFEINLWHSDAMSAADRAFQFKSAVKELARRQGKRATFMAKPFNDEGGSGFHLHFSTWDDDGKPLFDDPDGRGRTLRDRALGDRRRAGPRPRTCGRAQPDDQLLQAVRAGHAGAVADRLGPGQPVGDGPHPAGARTRVAAGAPARRRLSEPVPGHRQPAGRGIPGYPRRAQAAGQAGRLRLRHLQGGHAAHQPR